MGKPTITAVKVSCSQHRYRISTDTGWQQGWWAITRNGLRRQVAGALWACGLHVSKDQAAAIVDLAQQHGYVTVAT